MQRLLFTAVLVACALCEPAFAQVDEGTRIPIDSYSKYPRWYLQGGAYIHYNDDEDYEGPPLFASIEYLPSEKWQYGFSMFQNSFGQFSQYAYVGRLFHPLEKHPEFHFKLTGGIVHGYAGEHHDTLPIRWGDSWGIGVIPTLGYRKGRVGYDIAFLKASAALFLVGWHFD